MPGNDKSRLRKQVLNELRGLRRHAFRCQVALRINASTTARNPSHAQSIAKNVLDLLGRHTEADSLGKPLLYKDDGQVDALSVMCTHGAKRPAIEIEAMPLSTFLADLSLAEYASRQLEEEEHLEPKMREDSVNELRKLVNDDGKFERTFGSAAYKSWLSWRRREAQGTLLGAGVTIWDLAQMYGVYGKHRIMPKFGTHQRPPSWVAAIGEDWERIFHLNPIRIHLRELPQKRGESGRYMREIDTCLTELRSRFGWIIEPLMVPVAMEVVIKPPPSTRMAVSHDLDNVLRDYLIPRFVDALKPPSDVRWTFDREAMREHLPHLGQEWEDDFASLPKSTRVGLARYEAWRLPRKQGDGSRGFVSISIVADTYKTGDLLRRIDQTIDKWAELDVT